MKSKRFSPRFSLLFITLPQALLATFLLFVCQSAQITLINPLKIIFGIQVALNVYVIVDAILKWNEPANTRPAHMIRLIGFLALMSAATPFLLKQFSFATPFSPETIYAILCLIPMIYSVTAVLYRDGAPLKRVGAWIGVCVGFPCLVAIVTQVVINSGAAFGGMFGSVFNNVTGAAADVLLILLFALFFAFVCLVASLVYHFRMKKAARTHGGESTSQLPENGGSLNNMEKAECAHKDGSTDKSAIAEQAGEAEIAEPAAIAPDMESL